MKVVILGEAGQQYLYNDIIVKIPNIFCNLYTPINSNLQIFTGQRNDDNNEYIIVTADEIIYIDNI